MDLHTEQLADFGQQALLLSFFAGPGLCIGYRASDPSIRVYRNSELPDEAFEAIGFCNMHTPPILKAEGVGDLTFAGEYEYAGDLWSVVFFERARGGEAQPSDLAVILRPVVIRNVKE